MSAASSYSQGMMLYRQKRYDEAVAAFAPVVDEQGLIGRLARYYQAQACRQAGLALARSGQLKAAQQYLRHTVSLIGPNADLAGYLARIYTQLGLHDRAEAQLEAASAHKADPVAPAGLALAQYRNGRPAQR